MNELTIDNGEWTIRLRMKKQCGQVLVLLILIMTVALATGLSIIQKSISDVSTASKVEQSSRAFSAAEAGIEQAIQADSGSPMESSVSFSSNSSFASINDPGWGPPEGSLIPQDALKYPPLAKEDIVQVWLADPDASLPDCGDRTCYKGAGLDIYWGNSTSDMAAIELTLVYNGTDLNDSDTTQRSVIKYRSKKWYFDHSLAERNNGFEHVACSGSGDYQCLKTIDVSSSNLCGSATCLDRLMLLRARLLYNSNSQPFAVQAVGTGRDYSLPQQAKTISSTGVSGETQRKVEVFQEKMVVPPYFDYAIFSAGNIIKQ